MAKFSNISEKNLTNNMAKPYYPLVPVKKDKYMTPDQFKEFVLKSEPIKEIHRFYSNGDSKKSKIIWKQITEALEEIAFKRNMSVIRFLGTVLEKLVEQMTDGIYVNPKAILNVKNILSTGNSTILYLPSHRSYADFVLMSYVCFAYDLDIPAIAAGMDFYSMFIMGTMLRNTGAFYMRRSFSSDRLYWDVFREYIRSLIADYHSGVEFFIEGTRSRSYKALTPKIGLFAMTLEPFMTRRMFDIKVVPVGFSYDKPVEEQLFAYELLGVPKPKESTLTLLKAFNGAGRNYGRMYVTFGETISLVDYFRHDKAIYSNPNEKNETVLSSDRLRKIRTLSYDIVDEQQRLILLTSFNLIATYFSYRSLINRNVNINEMTVGVRRLGEFLTKFNALLSSENAHSLDDDIKQALSIHSNVMTIDQFNVLTLVHGKIVANQNCDLNKLKGHNLSSRTIQCSIPLILLQIYVNPCMYWLHLPAFYVLANRLTHNKDEIFNEMKCLRQIFCTEFVVGASNEEAKLYQSIKYYDNLNILSDNELCDILLCSILPFVFCYLNVAETLLTHFVTSSGTEKEISVAIQRTVEHKLNENGQFVHPYCLSLDSISNALYSFSINKIGIRKISANRENPKTKFVVIDSEIRELTQILYKYGDVLKKFHSISGFDMLSKL